MKHKILVFGVIAAVFTSCGSAYRASQTPDDVYYSPAKQASVAKNNRNQDRYENYISSQDDQYLRMKVRDRERWSQIDDYAYWNDSRYMPTYSYGYYMNNWNSPYAWNSWSSPFGYYNYGYPMYGGINYYGGGLLFYPQYYGYGYSPYLSGGGYISKTPLRAPTNVSRPNLGGYRNGLYNNRNLNSYNSSGYSNSNRGVGNTLRRAFTPSNDTYRSNNNNNTYSAPQRSYTPSSSGSSSSGSGGGARTGGGVSRPPR